MTTLTSNSPGFLALRSGLLLRRGSLLLDLPPLLLLPGLSLPLLAHTGAVLLLLLLVLGWLAGK